MFRQLDDKVSVYGQLEPVDVATAAAQGFTVVINNRPDGEEAGQPTAAAIQSAAADSGLSYVAIPVDHSGFDGGQVQAMAHALDQADGPVLAFCRSGTRSTLLWALARAQLGDQTGELQAKARAAGYDLTPILPHIG